jgi:Fur family ferric uptake transcriptional regulator
MEAINGTCVMGIDSYRNIGEQKEVIIQKLRDRGCRITRQRRILIDIILEDECSCCKEIYYKAIKKDDSIGTATVYRMINTLEDIGAISRNNKYSVLYEGESGCGSVCRVELDDGTVMEFPAEKWSNIVGAGLEVCGYARGKRLVNITAKSCECISCNHKCDADMW